MAAGYTHFIHVHLRWSMVYNLVWTATFKHCPCETALRVETLYPPYITTLSVHLLPRHGL